METRDIFISYHTSSSADHVRKICAALEGAGITCWYAPRDVGANYAQSIVEAIRGCRVFLLLLNEQSNMSAHVLNEVNCAFDRFRNKEDITLLPFRISECTLSDDVYYYLGRIHIMDGTMPPEMVRIQELVDRIRMLLGREAERTAVVEDAWGGLHSLVEATAPRRAEAKTYRIIGSMVYPDNQFVGRNKELAQLAESLSGLTNKVFLVGMGGIGKSEIAKMYWKCNAEKYDVVLWISFAESLRKTVVNDYTFPIQGLRRSDYPEDDEIMYFRRKLRILKEISDRRVLIIVDNFDVTEDPDLEEFCSGSYSVLFTTRYHQKCRNLPEITVGEFLETEELLKLFGIEYTRILDAAGEAQVQEILKMLDGHPLSIRLVASAMQSRRISPEKMLSMLRKGAVSMESQNARAAELIFGRLRQVFQISGLTEEQKYLLKNLALVPLRGIKTDKLLDWCVLDEFDVIDDLIRKSWVIYNAATDEVHLHPLVADLMTEELTSDPNSCRKQLETMGRSCYDINHVIYEEKLKLREHIHSILARLPETHPQRRDMLSAAAKLGTDHDETIRIRKELLEDSQDLQEKIYLYARISHSHILSGRAQEGLEVALEGYELIRDMDVNVMPAKLGVERNNLIQRIAEAQRGLGMYEESARNNLLIMETADRFYYTTPQSELGWMEYHLAFTRLCQGMLEESERFFRHSIQLFESVGDDWSANYSYEKLADVLIEKKQYPEALELRQKGMDILIKYYGKETKGLAERLAGKAKLLRLLGQENEALEQYRMAAAIYGKLNYFSQEAEVLREMRGEQDIVKPIAKPI